MTKLLAFFFNGPFLKGPARLVDDKAREEIKELMSAGLENLDLDDLNCLVER